MTSKSFVTRYNKFILKVTQLSLLNKNKKTKQSNTYLKPCALLNLRPHKSQICTECDPLMCIRHLRSLSKSFPQISHVNSFVLLIRSCCHKNMSFSCVSSHSVETLSSQFEFVSFFSSVSTFVTSSLYFIPLFASIPLNETLRGERLIDAGHLNNL